MSNINIAIIDTGIDISSVYDDKKIIIDNKIQSDYFRNNVIDENGHGTCCINTILLKSKNVNIFPIKIYNEEGRTSTYFLLDVLEKLIDSNIDLINISSSSNDCTYENEINSVCNELNKKGKIVICSQSNNYMDRPCIPTKFKSVVGVKGDKNIFKDEHYYYNKDRELQMIGNSNYRFIKGLNGSITDFGGNSRLSSVITGEIANIMTEIESKNLVEIENELIKRSLCNENIDISMNLIDSINKKHILYNILDIINDNFATKTVEVSSIENYSIFSDETNINKYNAYDFLTKINNNFKINIDYKNTYLYELENINLLVSLIERYV